MIDPGALKTDIIRHTYQCWLGKCVRGRQPRRADLRPEEMRAILPCVFLVDVGHGPLAFRFRLVGTKITQWAEKEYARLAVDEGVCGPHWRRVHDV